MEAVKALLLSFPMFVFSLLVPLVVLYWVLVTLRLLPVELFERDSLRHEQTASTLVSLGFAGVPATFALSVLILLAGLVTLVVEAVVLSRLPLGLFRVPLGVAVLWASFALVSPLAARICHKTHRWFHGQRRTLLGETVEVTSEPDDDGWASAELLSDRECSVRLHGKPQGGSMPHLGEHRVLVKLIAEENAYRSVTTDAYCEARMHAKRLTLGQRTASHQDRSR